MMCPECGVWTIVKEARQSPVHGYRRRRECANGHRFTTEEVAGAVSGLRERLAHLEAENAQLRSALGR